MSDIVDLLCLNSDWRDWDDNVIPVTMSQLTGYFKIAI